MHFIQLQDADPETIVIKALGLNDLQKTIFASLRGSELTVKDLVEVTGRSRSVVQRALQDMLEKGVIVREGRTEKTVYYVYKALPFPRIRETVAGLLEEWHEDVQETLRSG